MHNFTYYLLFHIFIVLIQKNQLSTGDNITTIIFNYNLNTKILKSITLQDPILNEADRYQISSFQEYIKDIKSTHESVKNSKIVKNLYSTLKHFIKNKCFIVINNHEGADIQPTINFPIVLTKLDIAFSSVRYYNPEINYLRDAQTIWIPKEMVSKLNGNFSNEMTVDEFNTRTYPSGIVFKHLNTIWKPDTRYDSEAYKNPPKIFLSSKPWQCEILVDLFMPDSILRLGKHTEIFSRHCLSRLINFPSLRPPVHILVDTKSSIEEYDSISLAAWIPRRNRRFTDQYYSFYLINDVQLTAHVICNKNYKIIETYFECNIKTLNVIYPCPECSSLRNDYPLEPHQLSFSHIANLEKSQKSVAFPTNAETMGGPQLDLTEQIRFYIVNEHESIKMPLKNLRNSKLKFSDKIQILGFGYASIFTRLLGNLTFRQPQNFENQEYGYFTLYLGRTFGLTSSAHGYTYDGKFRVKNVLSDLHFVSCGSRGVESLPFLQFISAFNWEIWSVLITSVVLLSIGINILYKDKHLKINFSSSIINLLKVLLEQGNPFPPNFDKGTQAKFLLTGIFLAGLVISNAFKSENMYKIMLPRLQVSYYNIKELIEDNITIYSRATSIQFGFRGAPCTKPFNQSFNAEFRFIQIEYRGNYCWTLMGKRELQYNPHLSKTLENATEHIKMHPNVVSATAKTWKQIDNSKFDKILTDFGHVFWFEPVLKLQEELILGDLTNCSKTAWILPNYLAQNYYRILRKSGQHSDVGVGSYTSQELALKLYNCYIPSSILIQFSWMATTGLLEWWPRFVNRSDLVDFSVNTPKKPNMTGNILVIFVFFGSGVTFAITLFALEFWRCVVNQTRKVSRRFWNITSGSSCCFGTKIHNATVIIVNSQPEIRE